MYCCNSEIFMLISAMLIDHQCGETMVGKNMGNELLNKA